MTQWVNLAIATSV